MKKSDTESKVTEAFANLMIEKIKEMQVDWHKPWVMPGFTGMPQNISGRQYNGINSLMLMMLREKMGYQTPVYMTFGQARQNGWDVKKGEVGFPVELWRQVYKDKGGNKISYEDYMNLSEAEREQCKSYPVGKTYIVFNAEQTRLPEVDPEKWQEMLNRFAPATLRNEEGMLRSPELDYMLANQAWICPVNTQLSDKAFYSPLSDSITMPLKTQFETGEYFYGTLLHEMAHSTGHESRLNRLAATEYGREELVAEMTAAMMASQLGITKGIQEDNVAYLQGWLKNIQEKPEFLRTVMSDVNKACDMIQRRVMTPEMAEHVKNEAIASIDRFIEESNQKHEKAPVLSMQQFKDISPSLGDAHVPHIDNVIEEAYAKVKKTAPQTTAWVTQGSLIYVINDDAVKVAKALKLSTEQMMMDNGQLVDVLSFPKDNLSLYLPQTVRMGIRVAVTEAQTNLDHNQSPVLEEDTNAPKLHLATLGNGITAWEEGDNEYTAHISPERELKAYKDFHPVNLARLEQLASEGNMLTGNKGCEYLALKPLNLATRFIHQPYNMDIIPISCERVGDRDVICQGQTLIQQTDPDKQVRFEDYPLIQRPNDFIVSITGVDNMRSSLAMLQRAGIDTTRLSQDYFFETLQTAEESLSTTQKDFMKLCFKIQNQHTASQPQWAITAFSNNEGCDADLDPDRILPRYYIKNNAMAYNHPAAQEVKDGLPLSRMVLSQEALIRIKGRDNLPESVKILARYGINFTNQAGEMIEETFDKGQTMPRAVADRDYIYLQVKKGLVNDIQLNTIEYVIDDEVLLEVDGGLLRKAMLKNTEEEQTYLVAGFDKDGNVMSFTKCQGTKNNLTDARNIIGNIFKNGMAGNQGISEWKILHVDSFLRDTTKYHMMDVSGLKDLMNEHPYSFTVQEVYSVQQTANITNHINQTTMAKKTTDQVQEPVANQQNAQAEQTQQTASNEQQAAKTLREGAHIFQRKGTDGNLIPGVYGVMVVKDGVKSEVATLTKEDRDQYFANVKGKSGEEAEAIRKEVAERYITPEGKRIGSQQVSEKKVEDNPFVIRHANPEVAARITDAKVFKMQDGKTYGVRCKIDGEQQMTRPFNTERDFEKKLLNAFFNGYKGMSQEAQQQRSIDVAAIMFKNVLQAEKVEQSRGMGR